MKTNIIQVDGITYKVELDGQNVNISKQNNDGSFKQMEKSMEDYIKVLKEVMDNFKKTKIDNIIDIINYNLQNKIFNSIDDINKFINGLNLSPDEIKEINAYIQNNSTNSLGNNILHQAVYDKLMESLNKEREKNQSMVCNLSVRNNFLKLNAYEKNNDIIQNIEFSEQTMWEYDEKLKQQFINEIVKKFAEHAEHNDLANMFFRNNDDTCTMNLVDKTGANLHIDGISTAYGNDLYKIVLETKVKNNSQNNDLNEENNIQENGQNYEETNEQVKEKGLERVRKDLKNNNNGKTYLSLFVIFVLEAIMAISLITYLLFK